MRSATFALLLAFCMLGMLALGSAFGFDMNGVFARFLPTGDAPAGESAQAVAPAQGIKPMETPAGFRGPTGQPYVRGPVGPPPEE